MSVVAPSLFQTGNADPLIGQHAIHWVLSNESYYSSRRPQIDDWYLVGGTPDTCMYHSGDAAIIAFRGSTTLGDIQQDVQLSTPGGIPTKVGPALELIKNFQTENPDVPIQLTGHSLGGTIARICGQTLGLGIVTFNAGAPPSNPAVTGPNEVDYHIVFDIISAWESPNTVRIDKFYRPQKGTLASITGNAGGVYKAHAIDNFSNKKFGVIKSTKFEQALLTGWFNTLSLIQKKSFEWFIQTTRLPPLS